MGDIFGLKHNWKPNTMEYLNKNDNSNHEYDHRFIVCDRWMITSKIFYFYVIS